MVFSDNFCYSAAHFCEFEETSSRGAYIDFGKDFRVGLEVLFTLV